MGIQPEWDAGPSQGACIQAKKKPYVKSDFVSTTQEVGKTVTVKKKEAGKNVDSL